MSKDTVLGQVGNPVDVAEAYIYSMKMDSPQGHRSIRMEAGCWNDVENGCLPAEDFWL